MGVAAMKVLFFVQGLSVAASRYRVLQYLPFLEAAGIGTEIREFPSRLKGWLGLMPQLREASIVFVQRKRLPLSVLLMLRRMSKRIVFDFDDSVMFKNSLSPNPYSLRRRLSFKRMLRFTDLVVAGNGFLKGEADRYHGDVRILPTPIDGERYPQKEYAPHDGVRVGWIGDHGSIHYVEAYRDVWERIGERYGPSVELAIICDTFIASERIRVRPINWSSETEVRELMDFDIGVMPLFDDLWSRGKCGFKILQYLGVGVPAVCTPVGVNREVVSDGVTGFWAETRDEWVAKLSTLIEDAPLRERMGRAGRETIQAGYTVQVCAPKLIEWLSALAAKG